MLQVVVEPGIYNTLTIHQVCSENPSIRNKSKNRVSQRKLVREIVCNNSFNESAELFLNDNASRDISLKCFAQIKKSYF